MADPNSDGAKTDGAPAAEPQASAPTAMPFTINAQYVKDFSFENPRAPQVFLGAGANPQVQVGVDVGARQLGDNVYEVTLVLNANAKSGEEAAFVVELSYAGVFTVTPLPQEQLRPVLLIEGPRLLFPFARAIIANATRDGGFPPLMIAPLDFADLYRRQVSAFTASPPTASPTTTA
jgi:preprotein translocase subunit SecB